jgi:hypothetical protein
MAERSFIDREGVRWTVSVIETTESTEERERRTAPRKQRLAKKASLSTRPSAAPWLSFQSKRTRLRLIPFPSEWREMTDVELEDLLADATPI